jgi:hypothetical protein
MNLSHRIGTLDENRAAVALLALSRRAHQSWAGAALQRVDFDGEEP